MTKITTIEQLKEICTDNVGEVYMVVGGVGRSSKDIQYWPQDDSWNIYNHIDDSEEDYDSTEEFKKGYPLIFEAMEKGALFQY